MKLNKTVIVKIGVTVAIIVAVIVLWRVTGLHELFSDFITFLEKVARKSGPAGALAFLALSVFAASIGPFTVVLLVPAAVRIWGIPFTGLMLMYGGLLGAALTYAIGRFAGESVLRWFVRPKRLERWKSNIPEHAAFLMAVIVKFALPAEVGYAFGVIRYGLGKYLLVTLVSYIPIIAAILWGSSAFVKGRLAPVIISIVGLATLSIAAALYLARQQERAEKNKTAA